MLRIGTSYFISKESAIRYYASYGYDEKDIEEKIKNEEIHVGVKPSVKETELLTMKEGRYFIITDYKKK